MSNLEGFAKRLYKLRKEKDLSQSELGKLVDLHYTHISRYERGLSKPSAEALLRISEALGVSTDFLMEGTTDTAARTKMEDRDLLRQFQEIERLPEQDKSVIKIFLDAFLTKKKIKDLAA